GSVTALRSQLKVTFDPAVDGGQVVGDRGFSIECDFDRAIHGLQSRVLQRTSEGDPKRAVDGVGLDRSGDLGELDRAVDRVAGDRAGASARLYFAVARLEAQFGGSGEKHFVVHSRVADSKVEEAEEAVPVRIHRFDADLVVDFSDADLRFMERFVRAA